MSYTHPATPVALTPITVSFYTVNIADNIVYLRGLLPSPGAAGKLHVSDAAETAGWLTLGANGLPLVSNGSAPVYAQLGTAGLADGAITSAKIVDGTIVDGDISGTAAIAFTKLAAVPITKSGDTGVGSLAFASTKSIAFATENAVSKIDLAGNAQYLIGVESNGLRLTTPQDFKVYNVSSGTPSLHHNTATHTLNVNGQSVWNTPKTGEFSGSQALTTSFADVSGASFSADRNGVWLVLATAEYTMLVGDSAPHVQIVAGVSVQEEGVGVLAAGTTTVSVAIAHAFVTVSGTTTIKAQVKKNGGSADSTCEYVKISGIWLAPS